MNGHKARELRKGVEVTKADREQINKDVAAWMLDHETEIALAGTEMRPDCDYGAFYGLFQVMFGREPFAVQVARA
jgi:hypothetical protein